MMNGYKLLLEVFSKKKNVFFEHYIDGIAFSIETKPYLLGYTITGDLITIRILSSNEDMVEIKASLPFLIALRNCLNDLIMNYGMNFKEIKLLGMFIKNNMGD